MSLPLRRPQPEAVREDLAGERRRRRRELGGPLRPPHRLRRRLSSYSVSLATPRQRLVLAGLCVLWAVGAADFWGWWLRPGTVTTIAGMAVNSALLALDFVVLPLWLFFFLARARRPDRRLPLPRLRVAMVVTKAPSEPWPLVRETLRAMLDQDLPYGYDVWLADERPTAEVEIWCERHGVRISSRAGVADYHRSSWPRRTRCKEGNLAYFYDHWGYELYDVVAQLDADHVPAPDYLRSMVRPFADPDVGYVAAPSICDSNASRSWSARARLYAEAVLHGPLQAGSSGTCAPSCIGSHYAVRTAALQRAGGLGPELAEDFSTTLLLNADGWLGAFAIDAEAHGAGPETFADCATQELQWSRSMMVIALRHAPAYWRRLRPQAKLRLGFCELWYPLFSLFMVSSVALPLVALLTGRPLVDVSLAGFLVRAALPIGALMLITAWLRRCGWLRPHDAPVVSWEAILFQLARWPWALIGCVQALVGCVSGREFEFAVTPKGGAGTRALQPRVLAPYLAVSMFSAVGALAPHRAALAGYALLALINAAAYAGVAAAIVLLHARENRLPLLRADSLSPMLATVASALLVGGCAMALHSRGVPRATISSEAVVAAAPWPDRAQLRVALGVTTAAFADNESLPWQPPALTQVNAFEQQIREHVAVVMWYADWAHGIVEPSQLAAVARRGSVPEITWEPWDATVGVHNYQPRYALATIVAGQHDSYIRAFAFALKRYGRPVLLRFAQEMNGDWYPWSENPKFHNGIGEYAQAWRHVHDVFAAVGATNVRWVWAPVAAPLPRDEFPGSSYVDVLGVSGFNGGARLRWGGWESFGEIFNRYFRKLEVLAPGKPIEVSEVGTTSAGGDEAQWISAMFTDLRRFPAVHSLVWFDIAKQADWRIEAAAGVARAFAAGAAGLRLDVPAREARQIAERGDRLRERVRFGTATLPSEEHLGVVWAWLRRAHAGEALPGYVSFAQLAAPDRMLMQSTSMLRS